MYSEYPSDFWIAQPLSGHLSDVKNLPIVQFRPMVSLSVPVSLLSFLIGLVVCLGPQKKMGWTDAVSYITLVEHVHSIRNWTMRKNPRESMRKDLDRPEPIVTQPAVPKADDSVSASRRPVTELAYAGGAIKVEASLPPGHTLTATFENRGSRPAFVEAAFVGKRRQAPWLVPAHAPVRTA
jgi:hypothetical protein